MSRTVARFTQADVARAVRAAKQAGAGDVVLQRDGTIIVRLSSAKMQPDDEKDLEPDAVVPM